MTELKAAMHVVEMQALVVVFSAFALVLMTLAIIMFLTRLVSLDIALAVAFVLHGIAAAVARWRASHVANESAALRVKPMSSM